MFQALALDILLEGDAEVITEDMGEMGDRDLLLLRDIGEPDLILVVRFDIGADPVETPVQLFSFCVFRFVQRLGRDVFYQQIQNVRHAGNTGELKQRLRFYVEFRKVEDVLTEPPVFFFGKERTYGFLQEDDIAYGRIVVP